LEFIVMLRQLLITLCIFLFSGCATMGEYVEAGATISEAAGYSPSQVSDTVKEALSLSVSRASDKLAQRGAYSQSQQLRLQLPHNLQEIAGVLATFGLDDELSSLEGALNRGAEMAAAEVKQSFLNTVNTMTVSNALGIIRGGDTAATDYFRAQTEASLHRRYQTVMQDQLGSLGYYENYRKLQSAYRLLPIPNKPDFDFEQQMINKALDGLFRQIAIEEMKIRENPAEQGSLLLGTLLSS
jgi:hypothetical protein